MMNLHWFVTSLRKQAKENRNTILVIGGQSGSGKSHFINYLLKKTSHKDVTYWDLETIRDTLLCPTSEAKAKLYHLFGCSNIPSQKKLSAELCRKIQKSPKAILTYYLWLEKNSRLYLLNQLNQQNNNKEYLWIFELVSPIDRIWQIADLYVQIAPPNWRIESQLMRRLGVSRHDASNIRNLHKEAIEIKIKSDSPWIPDLIFGQGGEREAELTLNKLRSIEYAHFGFRT
jgi:dephospho-CoA kinase